MLHNNIRVPKSGNCYKFCQTTFACRNRGGLRFKIHQTTFQKPSTLHLTTVVDVQTQEGIGVRRTLNPKTLNPKNPKP